MAISLADRPFNNSERIRKNKVSSQYRHGADVQKKKRKALMARLNDDIEQFINGGGTIQHCPSCKSSPDKKKSSFDALRRGKK